MNASKRQIIDERIYQHYNIAKPTFAYCVGGLRRIAVDPKDGRARQMLLAHGPRYFSKNQLFIYSCLKHLPVDLYFDIGVNYGECLVAAPLYSKVETRGFEANPALIKHLNTTLRWNRDLQHITLIPKAMSDEPNREVTFYVSPKWSGKSSLVRGATGSDNSEIQVATTSVDSELRTASPPNLFLAKIDVEGHEPLVLKGARQTMDSVPNSVFLLEFDSRFLSRAGHDIESFLFSFMKDYSLMLFTKAGFLPIQSLDALYAAFAPAQHLHGDLVLYRFSDSTLKEQFLTSIAERTLRQLKLVAY